MVIFNANKIVQNLICTQMEMEIKVTLDMRLNKFELRRISSAPLISTDNS